jgi:hypothetical protein
MQAKPAITMAAALLIAAALASPAEAARKHKKKVWRSAAPQSIVVHPATRWPHGAGTGAIVRGHLPRSAVRFGYGYGRFDADFNAYTGYDAYGATRRRPWQY